MIEITQPTPRNIGLMNTQNTIPMIEAMMIATTLATPFMRLRLEMDALPRLSDMLLFVFIVRHFFYASIGYRSFACSLNSQRGWRKGMFALGRKIRVQNEYSPELA
jgi:hypothetical protein